MPKIKDNNHAIRNMGIVGSLAILSSAAISTIWSVYLESILHDPAYVGLLMALFSVAGVLTYIVGTSVLEKSSKIKTYSMVLVLLIVSYLLFTYFENAIVIIILGFVIGILESFRRGTYGIIVRNNTKDHEVSKSQGFIYTFLNAAYLLAPIIAGFIASEYERASVFLFAAIALLISLIIFNKSKISEPKNYKKHITKPFKYFIDFFKNKDRIVSYLLGGGLNFWWVLIYVYVPIHIIKSGLDDSAIGIFMAAVSLPLLLMDYQVGKFASKNGFKKVFFVGFFILGILGISAFFIENIYVLLGALALSGVGASMIEPTSEAYIFNNLKKTEFDRYYPIYKTNKNANSIIAKFISGLILIVLPFESIYLFFGGIMIVIAIISTKAKEIIENGEKPCHPNT